MCLRHLWTQLPETHFLPQGGDRRPFLIQSFPSLSVCFSYLLPGGAPRSSSQAQSGLQLGRPFSLELTPFSSCPSRGLAKPFQASSKPTPVALTT